MIACHSFSVRSYRPIAPLPFGSLNHAETEMGIPGACLWVFALEYQSMGERSGPKSPVVIEVDRDNKNKDIDNKQKIAEMV